MLYVGSIMPRIMFKKFSMFHILNRIEGFFRGKYGESKTDLLNEAHRYHNVKTPCLRADMIISPHVT